MAITTDNLIFSIGQKSVRIDELSRDFNEVQQGNIQLQERLAKTEDKLKSALDEIESYNTIIDVEEIKPDELVDFGDSDQVVDETEDASKSR